MNNIFRPYNSIYQTHPIYIRLHTQVEVDFNLHFHWMKKILAMLLLMWYWNIWQELYLQVVLPKLKALELCEINVKKIWHNQTPCCFQHLTQLIVWECQKLKFIFYASMIKSLKQLQHLEIRSCRGLQAIISEEGADQEPPCFSFPRVTIISLCYLPEVTCSCPVLHTSEWPELKKLDVFCCDKFNTFASESFSFRSNENNQISIVPFFPDEKVWYHFSDFYDHLSPCASKEIRKPKF